MSWQPIAAARPAVQIHLATVMVAFAIGTWMIVPPKGTRRGAAVSRRTATP
jgi:uncharacterized membrane protein